MASPAGAETLLEALASAYSNNPTLNAQRASLRATDEGVPQALSGYRPNISAGASIGTQTVTTNSSGSISTNPRSIGVTITQPIFLGFRTQNSVKMAETAVLAGRELLRSTEQDTLLQAVQAFMGVVRAQAILNLREQSLGFYREQVRAANDRLNVGEGTRTDVAQTQAALAGGQSDYNTAVADLNTAIAVYEQIIGHKPRRLGRAQTVENRLPKTLDGSVVAATSRHPAIIAAGYNIDIASYNVKVIEGSLLPSVTVEGNLSSSADNSGPGSWANSASVVGRVSVPIYSGGLTSAQVREAKETLGQRRIEQDATRAQLRQVAISAWSSLEAARAQITAANSQIDADQLALSGIMEERKVGQRTTLDVLNAQQSLYDARVGLVNAQYNRVVASYTILSAIGKLDVDSLGLKVQRYDATQHYQQVRDKWGGLRTPDGR